MATTTAVAEPPPAMENEWNEAEVQSALARLHHMHIQVEHAALITCPDRLLTTTF